jgi:hypothetical protein
VARSEEVSEKYNPTLLILCRKYANRMHAPSGQHIPCFRRGHRRGTCIRRCNRTAPKRYERSPHGLRCQYCGAPPRRGLGAPSVSSPPARTVHAGTQQLVPLLLHLGADPTTCGVQRAALGGRPPSYQLVLPRSSTTRTTHSHSR